ncbi:MAG: hypothetical protein KF901_04905 [Myxococcales bacterium]|nr:hypothetical protein [Myxococcales bacterium]
MSTFVGRRAELAEVRDFLTRGSRWVTLTGPAGIGKTRLAREVLQLDLGLEGPRWFCDLTDARDPDAVAAAIRETLELPMAGTFGPAGKLELALAAAGPALLVLDNFEHVLPAAATVAELSRAAPELRVLVTSRERLRLPDEHVVELGPLGLPSALAPDEALQSESVRLLLGRARQVRHGFQLRPGDHEAVVRVTEQLEGIPLALELAAPRLVFLGARTLLERLDERFSLLASEQGTLDEAIAWSWDLLDDTERRALAQCAVFRSGFDLDAAEAVLTLDDPRPVVDVLQSLFEKSLLRAEGDGRFGLFLSIRSFAARRLDDLDATQLRHTRHYVDAAEARVAELHGPLAPEAWAWLRRERENLKAAAAASEVALAARAALALAPLMLAEGPLEEYDALVSRVLAHELAAAEEASLRTQRADALRLLGRPVEAREDLERALALTLDVPTLRGRALRARGNVALVAGELAEAVQWYERARTCFRDDDERVEEALTSSVQGAALAALGDMDASQAAVEHARELLHAAGALREEGLATAYLGNLFIDRGLLDDALVCFAQAEAIHDQVHDRFGSAFTTANRAILLHIRGETDDALRAYDAAIDAFRRVGARRYEGAFRGYGALARYAATGDTDAARRALGEATQQLHDARDERFEALFLGYLGGFEARAGAVARARATLDRADAQIASSGDPFLALAVDLQRTLLDAAEAREARAQGDEEGAAELDARRDARIARAHARDPESGRAPAERSADVRLALLAIGAPVPTRPTSAAGASRPDALVVARDASFFVPPGGAQIALDRRHALRNVLRALVEAHGRGEGVSRDDLIAAGWPGERVLPHAAANRLRVAIATLRKLGLHEVLVTRGSAYLLHPAVPVHEVDP